MLAVLRIRAVLLRRWCGCRVAAAAALDVLLPRGALVSRRLHRSPAIARPVPRLIGRRWRRRGRGTLDLAASAFLRRSALPRRRLLHRRRALYRSAALGGRRSLAHSALSRRALHRRGALDRRWRRHGP